MKSSRKKSLRYCLFWYEHFDFHAPSPQQSKRTAVALEYTYLLTTQLETQREYFEGEMAVLTKQKNVQIEQLQKQLSERDKEREALVSLVLNDSYIQTIDINRRKMLKNIRKRLKRSSPTCKRSWHKYIIIQLSERV